MVSGMASVREHSEETGSVTQLAAWTDFGCSILEAVDAHAFRWNQEAYDRFHQELTETLDGLKDQPSSSTVLVSADKVVRSIEQYHGHAQQLVDGSLAEFREITRILTSSLTAGRSQHDETGSALLQVQKEIEAIDGVEHLRIAKVRLAQVLGQLAHKEQERKQQELAEVNSLQERILILEQSYASGRAGEAGRPEETVGRGVPDGGSAGNRAGSGAAAGESLDPLTGLPNKVAAENAILGLNANPEGAFLVVVYVQRMAHFNARLGDKLGNELLFLTTQKIANALLRPDDQMFRWRGPAFVALLRRPDTLVEVKREVKRVLSTRFQFDLRGGAMLVTPALVAESFAAAPGNCAGLIQDVERFISLPATCGF